MGTTLAGTGETITLKTAIQAFGGAFKESIDEIRHNAPKHNATRDRAVTSSDYESLILASNSNIGVASFHSDNFTTSSGVVTVTTVDGGSF